jgi:hypothetical protein
MSKLLMMAGAVACADADAGPGAVGFVSAYVALAAGAKSRVFKVTGPMTAVDVVELDAATTLDMKRFQEDLARDLAGKGPTQKADSTWVCDRVRAHIGIP